MYVVELIYSISSIISILRLFSKVRLHKEIIICHLLCCWPLLGQPAKDATNESEQQFFVLPVELGDTILKGLLWDRSRSYPIAYPQIINTRKFIRCGLFDAYLNYQRIWRNFDCVAEIRAADCPSETPFLLGAVHH